MQETSLLANVRQATGIESFRRNKAIVLLGVRASSKNFPLFFAGYRKATCSAIYYSAYLIPKLFLF